MIEERLDRQMRIEGWDQQKLSNAKIAVIGDDKMTLSMYIASSAALGINNQLVIASSLENKIVEIGKKINPNLELGILEGYFVHREMKNLLQDCSAIVDFSNYNLAKKLLIEFAWQNQKPLIMVNTENGEAKIFTYFNGREWQEILEVMPKNALPEENETNLILSIIASGIALEETKNVLMNKSTSKQVIRYKTQEISEEEHEKLRKKKVLIVGAGALGNFVALGLGYLGIENIDIIDPDVIENTNLNRQILFYDAVGKEKAYTLAERINEIFKTKARGIKDYFTYKTSISDYDVLFDCVDNFETRIIMSEKCKENKKCLISGGTSYKAGQVVCYNPNISNQTPAELLDLYKIVDKRKIEDYRRNRASCTYQPDPSVIMSNQIIAGIMVDKFLTLYNPDKCQQKIIYYDAESDKKIGS
jgi:molybdopterin/thiamine biosynthesis adenylyltransferase